MSRTYLCPWCYWTKRHTHTHTLTYTHTYRGLCSLSAVFAYSGSVPLQHHTEWRATEGALTTLSGGQGLMESATSHWSHEEAAFQNDLLSICLNANIWWRRFLDYLHLQSRLGAGSFGKKWKRDWEAAHHSSSVPNHCPKNKNKLMN